MKRIILVGIGSLCAGTLLFNISCKKNTSAPAGNSGNDSVLVNIGNNIIMPSYNRLSATVNSLDSGVTAFNASPDADGLAHVQQLFKDAYIAWESASEYDGLGPASTIQPVLSGINLFPTLRDKVDTNIATGNYNVNTLGNAGAKGFPALDYLLFGGNTLANYTTDPNAANRKQYLAAVSADIKAEVNAVVTAWSPSGGNYLNTFINGTGNSVSSSLGLLINSLDQDFEILKNDRLGIPLGQQIGGSGTVLPNEVEAYYSGISAQLAVAQLKAVQTLYLQGLSSYVIKANAKYNGGSLNDTITAALATGVAKMQAVQDPMAVTIQSNAAPADAAYTQCQHIVVLLKTDMPSSLGVLITYGDNDGD